MISRKEADEKVLSWSPGSNNPVVADPDAAAYFLNHGKIVDYQPGDSTRYEVEIVSSMGGADASHSYLVMRNFGFAAIPMWRKMDPIRWTTTSTYPSGTWMGMRPLLAALGIADGEKAITTYDAQREADLRAHGYDKEPYDVRDARLGRQLRRLVEDDTVKYPHREEVETDV